MKKQTVNNISKLTNKHFEQIHRKDKGDIIRNWIKIEKVP